MDIERINDYKDERFPKEILLQHGAFIIDQTKRCLFNILDQCSAEVQYDDGIEILPVIDEFLQYAEHITVFYDTLGHKIAEFPSIPIKSCSLESIQPSQFFVDADKIDAISTFIRSPDDIIIPVTYDESSGKYISLDGHSRMYYAVIQGWKTLRIFESNPGSYIAGFVKEAQRRGVFTPKQLIKLSHQEYIQQWYQFCDDYFASTRS